MIEVDSLVIRVGTFSAKTYRAMTWPKKKEQKKLNDVAKKQKKKIQKKNVFLLEI